MNDILAKLKEPFPPERISWRVGSTAQNKDKGMALAYIDSRDVQDRLDQVCGAYWQCRYPHAGQKTVCEIGIWSDEKEWLWRSDGAGDSDVEAEKGALSDAFKRAAVKWGIGRYLYDLESPWVAIEQKGRSYVIAKHELPRLQKLLPGAVPEKPPSPGVAKARVWVNKTVRELNAADGPETFLDAVKSQKAYWVRIKRDYPELWSGPDGSGLRGEAQKVATIYECREAFDAWLKEIDGLAHETKTQQAAE